MKKLLFAFAILFAIHESAYLSAVYAQSKDEQLTVEEKKSAQDLADRFINRLDETGDIEPITKEMFASDFIARYVVEQKRKRSLEKPSHGSIFYTSGLNYDPALLDVATEEDWRSFYLSTFNFMQYGFGVTLNAIAKSTLKGGPVEDDELEKAVHGMYPKSIVKIFNADPILRNFIEKGDGPDKNIRTISDLRRVTNILTDAVKILRERNNANRMKMTPDARKVMSMMKEKMEEKTLPNLFIGDQDFFGFPKNTRFISIFPSITHNLLIVKIDGEYKILSATLTSID